MRTWRKKAENVLKSRGVARAALDGASRMDLALEALKSLSLAGDSARLGVWLEPDTNLRSPNQNIEGFHGIVWERESREMPAEWAHLSVEPPLPAELLFLGKTVEQDLGEAPGNPMVGPLAGLRYALWAPVFRNGQLLGVVLAGGLGKHSVIPREHAEAVAAELAVALGMEQEQQNACSLKTDLGAVHSLLRHPTAADSEDAVLASLAASCTATREVGGPGTLFAFIGTLPHQWEAPGEHSSVAFQWRGGETSWVSSVESEPLATVWKQALKERRVIGREIATRQNESSVARVVAYPLESDGELLGVLVAGLPNSVVSLRTFERLELRAALAASALRGRSRKEERACLANHRQALLNGIREPVLLLNEAGIITALSRGAREVTGFALDSVAKEDVGHQKQTRFTEIFGEREREPLTKWFRQAWDAEIEKRGAAPEPLRAGLQNGTAVHLRLGAAVKDKAFILQLEPLASRKSTDQPENAEAELQSVIEWLEEGVVLFDAQDNVRAMNTRFEQIAGFAPEESGKFHTLEALIGRLSRHAAEPARFSERWRELSLGIESGVREELQMALPFARVLERAARPVLDRVGRMIGRVEIYRDLTAQRAFHSKLLETEKLAALGQMVSGVAHELSNPLTSIMGYAHRLLSRQDLPGRTEEVRQIYQESDRATKILRQLLLNARETLPERGLVSLNQIVQRTVELQRFSLVAEKIRVEIDLDPTHPFVHGDPGRLQQVLMNLVGNARQAIEQQGQGGTIRLRTKRLGEDRVLLEVSDNGPGVPHGILARIFDPFFTTKPVGVGTGLGLAIVLSVVREHGGQVHVQSPPQGGAVFRVELPAASEMAQDYPLDSPLPAALFRTPAVREIARRGARIAPAFERANPPRVLVVEDEPTVARLIADVLEDEGMQVEVLLDGRQALDRAGHQEFDLVICDMKMPGLDGQNFYKSLERSRNPLRGKFLFVTGDVMAAQTREFLERNRLPHVAKPFRVEELTEKVHGVLDLQALHEDSLEKTGRKNAARNG